MTQDQNGLEKMTKELIGKSLLKPVSADFDDRIMKKIQMATPVARLSSNGNTAKKAWRYLGIALACMLVTIALIAKFSGDYAANLSLLTNLTFTYILYGGMMLLVPLVLYQFDALIQMMFWQKTIRPS